MIPEILESLSEKVALELHSFRVSFDHLHRPLQSDAHTFVQDNRDIRISHLWWSVPEPAAARVSAKTTYNAKIQDYEFWVLFKLIEHFIIELAVLEA